MKLTVYTDGSGTTGGPAGIGFVAFRTDQTIYIEDALPLDNATNQQAEILAAAWALHCLPPSEITIISDSEYLVKGWNEYLPMWKLRNWKKSNGKPPKNVAHWQRLCKAAEEHWAVVFEWTRGHNGTHGNERADELARLARCAAKERSAL